MFYTKPVPFLKMQLNYVSYADEKRSASPFYSEARHNVTCTECEERYSRESVPNQVKSAFAANKKRTTIGLRPRPVSYGLCSGCQRRIEARLEKINDRLETIQAQTTFQGMSIDLSTQQVAEMASLNKEGDFLWSKIQEYK